MQPLSWFLACRLPTQQVIDSPTVFVPIYMDRELICTGHTKKVVTNAVLFLGYCTGNLAGPFFYKDDQKCVGSFSFTLVASIFVVHANVQATLRFGYLVHDRLASHRGRPYRSLGISPSLGKPTAGSYPVANGRWIRGKRFGCHCVFGFDRSGELEVCCPGAPPFLPCCRR